MALNPKVRYSGQVSTADPTGYPYGRAQNQATFGDGTGTPLEKDFANDIFGLQQALLVAAGITPSGAPDKADASQYLQAIQTLIGAAVQPVADALAALQSTYGHTRSYANYAVNEGVTPAVGAFYPLTLLEQDAPGSGDFALAEGGTRIVVPRAGRYLVLVDGVLRRDTATTHGNNWDVSLMSGNTTQLRRYTNQIGLGDDGSTFYTPFALHATCTVSNPANRPIGLRANQDLQRVQDVNIFVKQISDL